MTLQAANGQVTLFCVTLIKVHNHRKDNLFNQATQKLFHRAKYNLNLPNVSGRPKKGLHQKYGANFVQY